MKNRQDILQLLVNIIFLYMILCFVYPVYAQYPYIFTESFNIPNYLSYNTQYIPFFLPALSFNNNPNSLFDKITGYTNLPIEFLSGLPFTAQYQNSVLPYSNLNQPVQNNYQIASGNFLPIQSPFSSFGYVTNPDLKGNSLYIPNSLTGLPNSYIFPSSYFTDSRVNFSGVNIYAPAINGGGINPFAQGINPNGTNFYSPISNINGVNPNQLTFYPVLPGIFDQRYYPYPVLNQGLASLNYNSVPLSAQFQPLPYILNNSYYNTEGINGQGGVIRTTDLPTAQLVLANPDYGMYCWDPIGWLDGGYNVGIWCSKIPIRAQSFDKRGRLLSNAPSFSVDPTGETGIMSILDSANSLYRGLINASAQADYLVRVTVDTASTLTVAKRRYSTCDACHPEPPGHIGISLTWGNCHECHDLGIKMHKHAYKAGIAVDNCYKCHPSGCLSGAHGQLNIWCTSCHGSLKDAYLGKMKLSGQLGKPQCADCHDSLHSEPGNALFVDSAGHGGVWCINCHGATHIELAQPVGLNNCRKCHTVQPKISWMGPNCALCHGSSYSPHLVND